MLSETIHAEHKQVGAVCVSYGRLSGASAYQAGLKKDYDVKSKIIRERTNEYLTQSMLGG